MSYRIDLEDLLKRAFVAGFKASAEGFNGEYPFDFDENRIERETAEVQKEAVEEILRDVELYS